MTSDKKILLLLLPYWTPMIPPMGVTSLKSHLQKNDYIVETADLNINSEARSFYNLYFNKVKEIVPENKRSNYYSIGHHVLGNHLMCYINKSNEEEYKSIVKLLIEKFYYVEVIDQKVVELNVVIDQYFKWLKTHILELIQTFSPKVLGITAYRDTLASSLFVFRLVKSISKDIKTVMGGSIFSEQLIVGSPDYNFFLEKTVDCIDKIIIGQGEKIFHAYLENKLSNNQRVYTEDDIDKKININLLDRPDYSDIDVQLYPFLGLTGSNGCEFSCSFCNVLSYFGGFEKKNIRRLVGEMNYYNELYGKQLFYLTDHMLNPIMNELSDILIENKSPIYWTGYLRVDDNCAQIDITNKWRKGGFYCARLGIESGSQKVLDLIGKKITIAQSKSAVIGLARAGIKTTTYWFVGHPDETEDDFQQTLNMLEELKDYIYEAESDYFNYNFSGQTNSDKWADQRRSVFPEKYNKLLYTQTWTLDCYPQREITMDRLNRFVEHCKKLGIPNPYNYREIYYADERWSQLRENSVPSIFDFMGSDEPIDDRNKI